jgi:hypothetical protein
MGALELGTHCSPPRIRLEDSKGTGQETINGLDIGVPNGGPGAREPLQPELPDVEMKLIALEIERDRKGQPSLLRDCDEEIDMCVLAIDLHR